MLLIPVGIREDTASLDYVNICYVHIAIDGAMIRILRADLVLLFIAYAWIFDKYHRMEWYCFPRLGIVMISWAKLTKILLDQYALKSSNTFLQERVN